MGGLLRRPERGDGAAVVEVISQGAAGSWQMVNRHKTMLNDSFDQRVAKVVVRKANTTVAITAKDNMQEAMAR